MSFGALSLKPPVQEIDPYVLEMRDFIKWSLLTGGRRGLLLKRKWQGEICSCFDPEREKAESSCINCFGTSFSGGYERPLETMIMMVGPQTKVVTWRDHGRYVERTQKPWTLHEPMVVHGDVFMVRENQVVTAFELTNISPVVLRELVLLQEFDMIEFPRTHPIYRFNI